MSFGESPRNTILCICLLHAATALAADPSKWNYFSPAKDSDWPNRLNLPVEEKRGHSQFRESNQQRSYLDNFPHNADNTKAWQINGLAPVSGTRYSILQAEPKSYVSEQSGKYIFRIPESVITAQENNGFKAFLSDLTLKYEHERMDPEEQDRAAFDQFKRRETKRPDLTGFLWESGNERQANLQARRLQFGNGRRIQNPYALQDIGEENDQAQLIEPKSHVEITAGNQEQANSEHQLAYSSLSQNEKENQETERGNIQSIRENDRFHHDSDNQMDETDLEITPLEEKSESDESGYGYFVRDIEIEPELEPSKQLHGTGADQNGQLVVSMYTLEDTKQNLQESSWNNFLSVVNSGLEGQDSDPGSLPSKEAAAIEDKMEGHSEQARRDEEFGQSNPSVSAGWAQQSNHPQLSEDKDGLRTDQARRQREFQHMHESGGTNWNSQHKYPHLPFTVRKDSSDRRENEETNQSTSLARNNQVRYSDYEKVRLSQTSAVTSYQQKAGTQDSMGRFGEHQRFTDTEPDELKPNFDYVGMSKPNLKPTAPDSSVSKLSRTASTTDKKQPFSFGEKSTQPVTKTEPKPSGGQSGKTGLTAEAVKHVLQKLDALEKTVEHLKHIKDRIFMSSKKPTKKETPKITPVKTVNEYPVLQAGLFANKTQVIDIVKINTIHIVSDSRKNQSEQPQHLSFQDFIKAVKGNGYLK